MAHRIERPRPRILLPLLLFVLTLALLANASLAQSDPLPSRPFLGVTPAPAAEGADAGAPPAPVLGQVLPGGTGAALGLQSGDRIRLVNRTPIDNFQTLVDAIGRLEVGDELSVAVVRGEQTVLLDGTLQGRPRESSDAYEVIYSSLDVGTASEPSRVRTITYRPPGATADSPQPAVYYIQGYTCGSVDHSLVPELTMQQILERFGEAGYVVYKQEKPGVGDSLGPNCADIDFETELHAFREGLKNVRTMDFVDAEHVHIFGHSLGGVQGPLLARDLPVKSIMAYGAVTDSWRDYMLDIFGKQALIFGTPEAQAAANRETARPLVDAWLASDRDWDEIMSDPALAAARDSGLLPIQGDRVFGRSYRFFRGLNRYDLKQTWREIDSHALAIHGSLDIQAINADWTEEIVDFAHNPPERIAEAVVLDGAEHAFLVFESREEQLATLGNGSYAPADPGERYDERAAETMLAWLQRFSPAADS
jgi:pimeloyl-ACP methyl ester carboxylesterase